MSHNVPPDRIDGQSRPLHDRHIARGGEAAGRNRNATRRSISSATRTDFKSFWECFQPLEINVWEEDWRETVAVCCALFPGHASDSYCAQFQEDGEVFADPDDLTIEAVVYCSLAQSKPTECTVMMNNPDWNYYYCRGIEGSEEAECCATTAHGAPSCSDYESCATPGSGFWAWGEYCTAYCLASRNPPSWCSVDEIEMCLEYYSGWSSGTLPAREGGCCAIHKSGPHYSEVCAEDVSHCFSTSYQDNLDFCYAYCQQDLSNTAGADCTQVLFEGCRRSQNFGYCCRASMINVQTPTLPICANEEARCRNLPYSIEAPDANCVGLCHNRGIAWCQPYELASWPSYPDQWTCGERAWMQTSDNSDWRAAFQEHCGEALSQCEEGDSSEWCESYCRYAWRDGIRPTLCRNVLPDAAPFMESCYPEGKPDDMHPVKMGECCVKHPAFDYCSRYIDECITELPSEFTLFDPLPGWRGMPWCSAICRDYGDGTSCGPKAEMELHVCVAEQVGDLLATVSSFAEFSRETFSARVSCCASHPEKSEKCKLLQEICTKADKGEKVVDDYGDPVEGELLTLLLEECEKNDLIGSGLSGGAIAGIVIGVVVVVGAATGALVYFLVFRKHDTEDDVEDDKGAA